MAELAAEIQEYKPRTAVEARALDLLGAGVSQEAVASAVGVSAGYISQLVSNEHFASAVAAKRYLALTATNERDKNYDNLEDKLLEKLEKSMPLMLRPMEITKALATVNACKRRGATNNDAAAGAKQVIVNLTLPIQIAQKFATNVDNQVVKAGNQELLTMPSSTLLKQAEKTLEIKQNSDPLLEALGE